MLLDSKEETGDGFFLISFSSIVFFLPGDLGALAFLLEDLRLGFSGFGTSDNSDFLLPLSGDFGLRPLDLLLSRLVGTSAKYLTGDFRTWRTDLLLSILPGIS